MAENRWGILLRPSEWWEGLKRFIRLMFLRLLRIQASPHSIAIGLASGVFIGLLPVLPFQTVLAIGLAFIVRGSKVAAALGTWVSNPLNWIPCYMMFYYVGKAIVPFDIPPFHFTMHEIEHLWDSGWKLITAMMVGGLVVATPSAVIAYFASFKLVTLYRKRKEERALAKRQKQRSSKP